MNYSESVTNISQGLPEVASGQDGSTLAPLRVVANRCSAGTCPTVYISDSGSPSGTVVVQGYTVSGKRAGIDVPDGETLVEIPIELLTEAVRRLS
jgi:hypothetical protein